MGYACPVCAVEEADAVHLANHLAITASLGREEHREWLAEHAPDWGECTPEELGEIVSPHATEIDTPEFEAGSHGHDHGHEPGRPDSLEDGIARQSRQPGRGSMTTETETVLREAAELTREMQSSSDEADGAKSDADDPDDPGGNENA
ncbi:DUF5810 domain-containing protein [Natrinema longum]|uniref:Uncharacterized protein n=1 Tax=Natrinema longum TaxID=370324 RepID=A0A8A2U6C1_9EURY|nr:DUF5810 domain-containing protein [Natrinema longum]MBZ6494491.1 hypothetical protein [Natrinema longum]QSW84186.1 hypothetical protein J0X27_12095 [Natrinema longum]